MRATKRRRTGLASFCPVAAFAAACPLACAQLQVQPSIALTILPAANITVYQTSATSAYSAPSIAPTLGSSPAATNESAAGNSPVLVPPAPPAGLPSTLSVDLTTTPANLSGVVKAPFAGLSIELSIVQQVVGKSGSLLQVPFLNYIQNIRSRAGAGPIIRLGGNTQDTSSYNASAMAAVRTFQAPSTVQSVDTPDVELGPELFNIMLNVSDIVDVQWVFGINFNSPDSNAVEAAAIAQSRLGASLLTLQLGNEPDLYVEHEVRSADYGIPDYVAEWGQEARDIDAGAGFDGAHAFAGPSVCCEWTVADVLAAGYLSNYSSSLGVLSVQHYPDDNCAATGKTTGRAKSPQSVLSNYLNHTGATYFISGYGVAATAAAGAGIPLMMLETNTASCGGFPGVSDSFAATLWMVDYSLALAVRNFSAALFHVGGQNVYYNAFTAPPTNQSSFRGWDTGSIYPGFLVVAEALGPRRTSQVAEVTSVASASNQSYVGYTIYEDGTAQRVVLINYVTGASPYTASLRVPSSSAVLVKYLVAPSTASHYNISWSGQTAGSNTSFSSDGTLSGTMQTTTVDCSNGVCDVQVPAPGIALVGLTPQATSAMAAAGATSTSGFPTTTAAVATVTIDQAALRTSNGMMGEVRAQDGELGGTGPIKSLASKVSVVAAGLLSGLGLAIATMQR